MLHNRRGFQRIPVVILCMLALFSLSGCGGKDDHSAYGTAIAELGDNEPFAFADIDTKHSVLLATDQAFDNGNGMLVSVTADVYYIVNGKVEKIGRVEGTDTAYPIVYDRSGLYVCTGHSVERYRIDEKKCELILAEGFYETVDENGAASYRYWNDQGEKPIEAKEYQDYKEQYGDKNLLLFKYGAS